MDDSIEKNLHCGFVAIIGRPNVGKSTLMNHLIGQKISITSDRPQTTQRKINGIVTIKNYQYIFVDTPGFQSLYLNKFNKILNQNVIDSINDVDVILYVVEAGIFNDGDAQVLSLLNKNKIVILVINKKDKIKQNIKLELYAKDLLDKFTFKDFIFVSSKHHQGLDLLLDKISKNLPSGNFLYPVEHLTDRSNKFLCAEIIREKLFRYLGEELPYNMTVEIEKFDMPAKSDGLVKIFANIIVDKTNHKGIVIGANGEKIKKISTLSRLDIEKLLGRQVFLQVWVVVKEGFSRKADYLTQFSE